MFIAGLVLFVGSLKFIVWPRMDSPHEADAIAVVAGAHDGREQYALNLAKAGLADVVLLSNPYGPDDSLMNDFCGAAQDVRILCFDPAPSTTRGEATAIATTAKSEGWKTIMVVTYRPHVSRVRYEMAKRFDGEVTVVAVPRSIPESRWPYAYLREMGGFTKTVLDSAQSFSEQVRSAATRLLPNL
ncbi:YdcF family protein [Rhodococcus rhodochrous]|uniref:YdcF family protein n=1 Tax=Rhodococcus rhodochrous TaxID=1829 RepID=UPI001782FB63|nr:YdcF family protein [Rhodococcus rhodochrous]